jgi:hypothetical protein
VAFAGIGVSLLLGSNAQVPCTKQTVSIHQHDDCVLSIQRMLDATDSHWGGSYVALNGNFNFSTQTQIEKFQGATANRLYLFTGDETNGVVGQNTWRELCYADNTWHGLAAPFDSAGCQVSFGVSWGGIYPNPPWDNP